MPGRGKKNTHAAKLREMLAVAADDLAGATKAFKEPPTADQGDEIAKDDALLGAFVEKMQAYLDAQDYMALYHIASVCSVQVFGSVQGSVSVLKSSGLCPFLVAAINTLAGSADARNEILTPVLDMAEMTCDNQKLRQDIFPQTIESLIALGTDGNLSDLNRRTSLSIIQGGVHGSEANRELVDLERLARYMAVSTDFYCQTYIAAIAGKLSMKKKSAQRTMATLTAVWGEQLARLLKEMFEANFSCAELFVVEFNHAQQDPVVQSMKCAEWNVGLSGSTAKFTANDKTALLLHLSPTHISFNLPCADDDNAMYDTIDIPFEAVLKLNTAKQNVTLEFKTSKLQDELARFAGGKTTLQMVAKSDDKGGAQAWAQCVGKRIAAGRKSNKRQSESKRKLRPEDADAAASPPPKVAKTDAAPVRAVSASQQAAYKVPRLSIDPIDKRGDDEPSPFHKGGGQPLVPDEEDLGDNDLENVFDELRTHFARSTQKRQQKGREGLERTLHGVQRLVDAYKLDSNKYDLRLADTVNELRAETEKAASDFSACHAQEKQLTKDIEAIHNEFTKTASAHNELLTAFQDELEETMPKIREQESTRLGKLKDMVDDEFTKLEEQVSKIQSQKTMMTRMMKFIMTNFD